MCLAIAKPAGTTVHHDEMARAYTANPDGCGFAVRVGQQILIHKGLWSFDTFWKRLAPYMALEMVIHFRWASAGAITPTNCHPFALTGGGALIHNGHMHGYGNTTHSDTADWIQTVLNPLLATYPDALTRPPIQHLLAQSLHDSKVVILTPTDVHIVHEAHGHWRDGVWYSNTSYLPVRPTRQPALLGWKDTLDDLDDLDDLDTLADTGPCACCEDESPWRAEYDAYVCGPCLYDATHDESDIPSRATQP